MPLGVGQGQNVGLRDFCHILTLWPPGASVFHKHMSSSVWHCESDAILLCLIAGQAYKKYNLLPVVFYIYPAKKETHHLDIHQYFLIE